MGSVTITLSDEAYRILKAQKKEGESFSDLILRTFPKGHPGRILATISKMEPNPDFSANVRKASEELRKNFRLRRYDIK